jgi:tetratricopeptide (TPR) repeat protein
MPGYLFAALAYDRLGKTEEPLYLIETAKTELKDDPWLHFNLTRYYANTKQPEAAIASLQKAIELGWQPNPLLWLEGTLCDPLLNPIRESEGYKDLVRKHFPKYYDIATRVPGKQ